MEKKKQELHIHIERWQDIVEVLDDKKKVIRLVLIIVIVGLALFAGIAAVCPVDNGRIRPVLCTMLLCALPLYQRYLAIIH